MCVCLYFFPDGFPNFLFGITMVKINFRFSQTFFPQFLWLLKTNHVKQYNMLLSRRTLNSSISKCWNSFEFTHHEPIIDNIEDVNYLQDILQYNYDLYSSKKVVVILPRQKVGPNKKDHLRGQFLLDETTTLVESIYNWKVIGREMISTANINSKTIFGKTNVANLKQYVREMNADALVFGVDILSPYQHHYYRECLNIEVFKFGF